MEYTSQQKKRWLQRYRTLGREVDRLNRQIDKALQEIDAIRATAEKSTTIPTGMPSGGGFKGPEDVWVKLIDLSNEVNRLVDKYVDERRVAERKLSEIVMAINDIDDGTLSTLLLMRYVDGATFEQIAVDMGYCIMQILRLHGKALEKLGARE